MDPAFLAASVSIGPGTTSTILIKPFLQCSNIIVLYVAETNFDRCYTENSPMHSSVYSTHLIYLIPAHGENLRKQKGSLFSLTESS